MNGLAWQWLRVGVLAMMVVTIGRPMSLGAASSQACGSGDLVTVSCCETVPMPVEPTSKPTGDSDPLPEHHHCPRACAGCAPSAAIVAMLIATPGDSAGLGDHVIVLLPQLPDVIDDLSDPPRV